MSEPIPGKLTDTSLHLEPGISLQQWARAGETIGLMHRGSPFWLGDWLVYGEDRFGEKHAQYVEETGLSVRTLLARARISRLVPPERRRDDLSLTHHAMVAGLLPHQQTELLARASREGLDTTAFRALVQAADTRPKPANRRPSLGEMGDTLADAAKLLLQALDAPVDATHLPSTRRDLIDAIARWETRREGPQGEDP